MTSFSLPTSPSSTAAISAKKCRKEEMSVLFFACVFYNVFLGHVLIYHFSATNQLSLPHSVIQGLGSSDYISHLPVSLVLSPVHRGHWAGPANLEEKEGTFSPSVLVFFLVARESVCRDPGRVSERGRWLSGWAAGALQHASTPCLPRHPESSLAGTLPLGF